MKSIGVIGLKGFPGFGGASSAGESLLNCLKEKYVFTIYSIDSHTDLSSGDYNGMNQIVFKRIKNNSLNTLFYYLKSAVHAIFFFKL